MPGPGRDGLVSRVTNLEDANGTLYLNFISLSSYQIRRTHFRHSNKG
jgi:hypothetical protein